MMNNFNRRLDTIERYRHNGKLSYSMLNSITNISNLINPEDCVIHLFIERIKNSAR